MKIVIPNAIDLVSSTVPENDEAAWVQGQSYGEGAKVLRQHYIYESLSTSNTSDPLSASSGISAKWRKLRASNRWAMFDDAISTQTVAGTGTDELTVTVRFDYSTCFALLNIVGESITASIKDDGAAEPYWTRTLNLVSDVDNEFDYEFLPISYVDTVVNDFSDAVFDDVPVCINGTLTVTIHKTGGGAAAGHMIVGLSRQPGATLYGVKSSSRTFSKIIEDDYGNTTLIKGRVAKTFEGNIIVKPGEADKVQRLLDSIDATPTLFIGDNRDSLNGGHQSLTLYGLMKTYDMGYDEPNRNNLAVTIYGMV